LVGFATGNIILFNTQPTVKITVYIIGLGMKVILGFVVDNGYVEAERGAIRGHKMNMQGLLDTPQEL
jgi:hypothetical protein